MRRNDIYSLTRIALFAALTSVLAFVSIPLPFSPVPVTAQSFGPMLAGLLLRPREAMLSQLLYVLIGAAGLPVFAGGASGFAVLAGATGGYLSGFVVGAGVTSILALLPQRHATPRRLGPAWLVLACLAGGVVVVYGLGVSQLALVTGLTPTKAIVAGALPFIPGDVLKACIAGLVGWRLRFSLAGRTGL
ncbi:MAG TPA: biotin transporter BioY [Firmicutes bacterium]|nr:biotin transporter BioY [Bacillota bacterium]